ncbi:MAG: hypothetical protein ACYC4B_20795 [Pirellulaceae bacterium]
MAGQSVNLEMTVGQANAVRNILSVVGKVKGLGDAANELGDKTENAGKKGADGFAKMGNTIKNSFMAATTAGGALAGLLKGFREINRELDLIATRHRTMASQQITVANAQRTAAIMLGDGADIAVGDLSKLVTPSTHGVPLNEAYDELGGAFSARGSMSASDALKTAQAGWRLGQHLMSDDRKALISGALETQKVFGGSGEENIAALYEAVAAARPESIAEFARTIAPGAANVRALGGDKDSYQFLTAAMIGVGQRAGDASGRRTTTGFLGGMKQIVEATNEALPGASLEERLAYLNSGEGPGEALRKELRGSFESQGVEQARTGMHGEAKTYVAMLELLDTKSKTWEEINAAKAKLHGPTPAAMESANRISQSMDILPEQQAALASRAVDQALQNMRQDVGPAFSQLLTDKNKELMLQSEVYSREADMTSAIQEINKIRDPVKALERFKADVELGSRRISNRYEMSGMGGEGAMIADAYASEFPAAKMNETDRINKAALDNLAAAMGQQIELLKEQNEMMKQQTPQPVRITGDDRPPTQPHPAPGPTR